MIYYQLMINNEWHNINLKTDPQIGSCITWKEKAYKVLQISIALDDSGEEKYRVVHAKLFVEINQ
jgi:hypothetical protein